MTSELLSVRDLRASWGRVPVLNEVSFDVHRGEFVVLLGPNGSGKTTLLRCLAGLERIDAGSIELDARRVERLPAHRRGIGLVSQEPSLFPHRTVRENIAYGPLVQGTPLSEVGRRVEELMELLDLGRFGERYPTQLSGGEAQRVALARALAPQPKLVLLDEPFASVDPELRAELRAEFRQILSVRKVAALHVTHDREEGLFLGERVFILMDGLLVQSGPPSEVYERPRSPSVARFLGYNVLPGRAGPSAVAPESLRVLPEGSEGVVGIVVASGPVGRLTSIHLRLPDGTRVEARRPRTEGSLRVGMPVALQWEEGIPLGPDVAAPLPSHGARPTPARDRAGSEPPNEGSRSRT